MLKDQNSKCNICGKKESRKNRYGGVSRLSIDHNHKTKKVRSLLCSRCNAGLGFFNDDTQLLEKALKYLKDYNN